MKERGETPLKDFHIDVKRVAVAHKFVLRAEKRCAYTHSRLQYGLLTAIEGEAEYHLSGGEVFTLREGDVLFLPPQAPYTTVLSKDFKHYTVNFDIHEESSDDMFGDKRYILLHADNISAYRRVFDSASELWQQKPVGFEMRVFACIYELLALFFSDFAEMGPNSAARRLLPAKEYIDKNVGRSVDIKTLASLVHMSPTNFRREWQKAFGETSMQYRDRVRLSYAKEYLLSGYYTVLEVSDKCGFSDVAYFVRFFKKHTGMSPRAYSRCPNAYL